MGWYNSKGIKPIKMKKKWEHIKATNTKNQGLNSLMVNYNFFVALVKVNPFENYESSCNNTC